MVGARPVQFALIVSAAIALLFGLGQLVSRFGPDSLAWVQIARKDATSVARYFGPHTPGEFLSVSGSVHVEDGGCKARVAAVFSGPDSPFEDDLREASGHCGTEPMLFAVLASLFIFARVRRSQPSEKERPPRRLGLVVVLMPVVTGIVAASSITSLFGVRAAGGVTLNSERAANQLAEMPVGSLWDDVADVRLDWLVVDGGGQIEWSVIRYKGWHVSYMEDEPDLAFFLLPGFETFQRYLASGRFHASGFTLRTGGWLPSLLAVITGFFAIRAMIRHRRGLRKGSCRDCGYDLTGNVSGRCPECGQPTNAPARASS